MKRIKSETDGEMSNNKKEGAGGEKANKADDGGREMRAENRQLRAENREQVDRAPHCTMPVRWKGRGFKERKRRDTRVQRQQTTDTRLRVKNNQVW